MSKQGYNQSGEPDPIEMIRQGLAAVRRERPDWRPTPVYIGPELQSEMARRGWLEEDGAAFGAAIIRDPGLAEVWSVVRALEGRSMSNAYMIAWLRKFRPVEANNEGNQ